MSGRRGVGGYAGSRFLRGKPLPRCGFQIRINVGHHLLDSYRPVIVDAGTYCRFQVLVGSLGDPSPGQFTVAEADGTYSSCRVARLACLTAWRIGAEQAPCSFFFYVQHKVLFYLITITLPFLLSQLSLAVQRM